MLLNLFDFQMSLKSILIIIILLIAVLLIFFSPKLIRIYKFMNLYQKDNIAENFISMDKLFNPGPMIKAADEPYTFKSQSFTLPQSYQFEGESKDLIEALDYFKQGNVPQAVVSNGRRKSVLSALQAKKLFPYFDFILCKEDYEGRKPDPAPYQQALHLSLIHI